MSRQEYKALAMGKTIISSVDNAKRGMKSTAKGICFGIGDYEQAEKDFRHLSGIVVPHYLVVFDRPDTLTFTKCQEQYIDWGEYDKLYSKKKIPRHVLLEQSRERYMMNITLRSIP